MSDSWSEMDSKYLSDDIDGMTTNSCIKKTVWTTKDGKTIPIDELKDAHLKNIFFYIHRQLNAYLAIRNELDDFNSTYNAIKNELLKRKLINNNKIKKLEEDIKLDRFFILCGKCGDELDYVSFNELEEILDSGMFIQPSGNNFIDTSGCISCQIE